ncbi:MAG: NAD(P)-binding domain-containing protein [Calditrichia bacterium]
MQESFLIWLVTCGVALLIFLPYFLRHSREQKVNIAKRLEAEDLGIIKAQAQYPQINLSLCIGCGACVDACPEKDVLRVVWGKAQIVNGLRCVGHGHCEPACPVQAIVVGLGDVNTRPDIPILSETGETSVPGLFIAGELGGLSLIKNAINQGRESAAEIVRQHTLENMSVSDDTYDAVVIGAGPAGLSGALRLAEAGLNYAIIDRQKAGGTILQYPRRKLVMTTPAEIPGYGTLQKAEYTKEELLEIWQDILKKKQICVKHGHSLKTIERQNDFFEIVTTQSTIKARKIILALGRRGSPRKLNIPGEQLQKVSYQLIDAQSYTNSRVLIVGGGDSAVEAAIGLAKQTSNTVHISYRKKQFFRIKRLNQDRIEKLINQGRIKPIWESNLKSIEDSSTVITTRDGDINLPNDYVFIFAGGIAPFDMLKEMGIRFGGEQAPIDE